MNEFFQKLSTNRWLWSGFTALWVLGLFKEGLPAILAALIVSMLFIFILPLTHNWLLNKLRLTLSSQKKWWVAIGLTFLGIVATPASSTSAAPVASLSVTPMISQPTTSTPTPLPEATVTPLPSPSASPTQVISPTAQPTRIVSPAPTKKLLPTVQPTTATTTSGLSNDNYYTNSDGNTVHSPTYSESVPSGASARCKDGTYSFSQSRRGTCSGHDGVAEWL